MDGYRCMYVCMYVEIEVMPEEDGKDGISKTGFEVGLPKGVFARVDEGGNASIYITVLEVLGRVSRSLRRECVLWKRRKEVQINECRQRAGRGGVV